MDIVDPCVDPRLVPQGSRAVVIAEHQTEYPDLPSVRTPDGQVITRWALTDAERTSWASTASLTFNEWREGGRWQLETADSSRAVSK